jgi:hypothetical protein
MPNPSLGFCLQRLLPSSSRHRLRCALPRLPSAALTCDLTSGLMQPNGAFRLGQCYPSPNAAPLLAFFPLEESPLGPWLRASTEPPLLGFVASLGFPIDAPALQSFKDPEVWHVLFREHTVLQGFCPPCPQLSLRAGAWSVGSGFGSLDAQPRGSDRNIVCFT